MSKEIYYKTNANGLYLWAESHHDFFVLDAAGKAALAATENQAKLKIGRSDAFVEMNGYFPGLGGGAATEHRRDLVKIARDAAKEKIKQLGFKPVLDKF